MTVTAKSVIQKARAKNIQLWVEGGQLHYRAPDGTMTPKLYELIRRHKDDVIWELAMAESDRMGIWSEGRAMDLLRQAMRRINEAYPAGVDITDWGTSWQKAEAAVDQAFRRKDMAALKVALAGYEREALLIFERHEGRSAR